LLNILGFPFSLKPFPASKRINWWFVSIKKDYGGNALLINVKPVESVYRNGFFSCFDGKNRNNDAEIRTDFLSFLLDTKNQINDARNTRTNNVDI
jgi:hypothetical protein